MTWGRAQKYYEQDNVITVRMALMVCSPWPRPRPRPRLIVVPMEMGLMIMLRTAYSGVIPRPKTDFHWFSTYLINIGLLIGLSVGQCKWTITVNGGEYRGHPYRPFSRSKMLSILWVFLGLNKI